MNSKSSLISAVALPGNGFYPVPFALPDGFSAKKYYHMAITMTMTGTNVQFSYLDFEGHGANSLDGRSMEEVISSLSNPFTGTPSFLEGPLDIVVDDDAYIVLQLDTQINWRSSTEHRAVTFKRLDSIDDYGRLLHLATTASPEPHDAASLCQLVYFATSPRKPDNYSNGINIHIEFFDQRKIRGIAPGFIPLIIDPDIKNPGSA